MIDDRIAAARIRRRARRASAQSDRTRAKWQMLVGVAMAAGVMLVGVALAMLGMPAPIVVSGIFLALVLIMIRLGVM